MCCTSRSEVQKLNSKKVKIAVSVLVALAIAVLSFTAGFFIERYSADKALASYKWALKTIRENYYFGEPDIGYTQTSLRAIADEYLDDYSEYYTKEEYAEVLKSNAGSKSGLGLSYAFVAGRGIYISRVVGNSPAYQSGLRAGDFVTSVKVQGGEETSLKSLDAFREVVSSLADGVEITLTAEDGNTYKMKKKEYTSSYTSLSTSSTGWFFGDSADGGLALYKDAALRLSYLPEGCAYLRLDQFYGTATKEFYSLIEKFNAMQCTSLILDLRSNGGGYVSVMQDIAGSFADGKSKLAMLSKNKNGGKEEFDCRKVTDANRRVKKSVKVFVLANAGTASASEALIGAMVCYGALDYGNILLSQYSDEYINWQYPRGTGVKNARTFGKGIMQSYFTNGRTGEVLKLTTAQIYWPDKTTSIHDIGITLLNGCTAVQTDWEWTKGDKELQSAVEIIKTKI